MSGHVYLYGLVRAGDAQALCGRLGGLLPVRGLGPARPVQLGAVAGVVSVSDDGAAAEEILPTRRNMTAHARVLEACLPVCPILPVCFGVVSPGIDAIGQMVQPREAELLDLLARFAGRAEYGVRITGDREAAIDALVAQNPALGRHYRAVAERGAGGHFDRIELGRQIAELLAVRRDRAQRRLLDALAPLAEKHIVLAPEEDVQLLRASFLLPMTGEAAFEQAVAAAAGRLDFAPGLAPQIRLVGPAAVSNFLSLRLEAPATLAAAG